MAILQGIIIIIHIFIHTLWTNVPALYGIVLIYAMRNRRKGYYTRCRRILVARVKHDLQFFSNLDGAEFQSRAMVGAW
jgi:hypothetical protein